MKLKRKVLMNNEFLSIFHPFYYFCSILCLRKYNINSSYVENISGKNIVCAIFAICCMIAFYDSTMRYTNFSVVPYHMIYNVIYSEYLINFSCVCIHSLYFSISNVELLSILSNINRILYSREDLKKYKNISWVLSCLLLVCCVVLVSYKLAHDPTWSLIRGLYVSTSIVIDMENVYSLVLVYILNSKTNRWNSTVESLHFENDDTDVEVDKETVLEEIETAIMSIIEAWNLTKMISGFMILFHFITTFIQTLVYVGVLIIWSQSHFKDTRVIISHSLGVLLWLSKTFFVELGLCMACEEFYKEILRAKTNVVIKMSETLPSNAIWKNILRVLNNDFDKMSACGVFNVEAVILLNFCYLVTTYTIVLLQFAFL